jgi:hypothetical protein
MMVGLHDGDAFFKSDALQVRPEVVREDARPGSEF